jgi:hypothetical protein
MRNKSFYIKIALVVLVSFAAVKGLSNEIFIADSPRLRPDMGENIARRLDALIPKGKSQIAQEAPPGANVKPIQEILADVPLKEVAQGVYAKEGDGMNYTIFKEEEMEFVLYTFTIRGEEVKLRVPKDSEPPSQEELEKIY